MEKIKKRPLISLVLLPFTKDRHEGKPARQKKGVLPRLFTDLKLGWETICFAL